MTRYTLKDGSTFVLAHLTLAEWAEEFGQKLLALGCSEKYVECVRKQLQEAKAA